MSVRQSVAAMVVVIVVVVVEEVVIPRHISWCFAYAPPPPHPVS